MARSFNGTNTDYLALPASSVLALTGDISVAGWINTTTTSNEVALGAYNVSSPFTGWGLGLSIGTASGKLCYWSQAIGSWQFATSTYNSGAWVHAGFTITGTGAGAGQFYKNGATDGTWSHTAPGAFSGAKALGASAGGAVNNFNGKLADFAVWNVALTAGEMKALSTGIRPYTIRPAALVTYWPIDGIASPEPDFGNQAQNGTVNGTAFAAGPPTTMFTPKWNKTPIIPAVVGTTVVPWPFAYSMKAA